MFDKRVKDSISFRFLAIISGILLVSTAVISIMIGINEQGMLKRTLRSKGQGLASYIAKLSQDPLIMKDYVQLDAIVSEANKDDDIMYAVIQDVRGKMFTSQYASVNYRSPRLKTLLSGLPKNSELPDIMEAIQKKEVISTISVPILAGTDVIGKVSMGMSEYTINQEITKTITFILALNLAVMFALGVVLYVAFKRIIFNPITDLAEATTRLARGDLSTKVEPRGGGEIRMLIDSFNRMAEDLGARTRELLDAQEELVRNEKLAILGQLSGSVGHELRNPLGVMSNAVYFLKMVLTGADETTKEYLDIIKNEIDNSLRIITDLLDFARTRPPQIKAVTARELTDESLGRCVIPDIVNLQTEIPDNLPLLRVDPLQMEQVLTNFITNAVQAMPDGGKLRVSARRAQGPGNREQEKYQQPIPDPRSPIPDPRFPTSDPGFVEISVTDTGEGVAPENMKKLFQPLFTTKAKGIGLGLVVCKNLVEANGGRIEVKSEPGEGTTFTVALPVEKDEKGII
ncbi:MAG: HAMP domain-containing protein [Desulfuromonadales bacterium]|nr:HAMP domain-containing protein [Desulfuromonadales bacterium]